MDIGHLRSLVSGTPSTRSFGELLDDLDQGEYLLEDHIWDYLEASLARWPDTVPREASYELVEALCMGQSPRALALCTHLTFRVGYGRTGINGASKAAQCPHLRQLTTLDIGEQRIGEVGLVYLARSPYLQDLTALNLSDNHIAHIDGFSSRGRVSLKKLVELDLSHNPLADVSHVLGELAKHRQLRQLDLSAIDHGYASRLNLTPSSALARLTHLRLAHNNLGNDSASVIARCEALSGLRELDLRSNFITSQGALTLAASPHLRNLVALDLADNHVGPEAERELRRALPQLRELDTQNHLKSPLP